MKKPTLRKLMFALPLAASSFLMSCVSDHYEGAGYTAPAESRYTTYVSLPSDFSGDSYYYNNRYYAGGRYEPGNYTHAGRSYNNRYFHNGEYIYGGDYRQSASAVSYRDPAVRRSSSSEYTTYRTLPRDHSGDAYYYNNRYYAGGRYEPGTYSHEGRNYNDRYFHNGEYLYGGNYRQSASVLSTQATPHIATSAYRTIRR